MTEDKMVGLYYQLNGHEFEQTLGDGEGQESLVCCSPWVPKRLDLVTKKTTHMTTGDISVKHIITRI